ncbi:beta-lactamase domain-containing protein [Ditylenchus destructor]|uniref:Beta-lactamase domain-containing protein n=1 Tax=Ditylenchus destructor TaxID=166010 RepID=A0AAD4MH02_9BILA|nr:beta-lactamase domain-containing protein [Ditylenchus destructor]
MDGPPLAFEHPNHPPGAHHVSHFAPVSRCWVACWAASAAWPATAPPPIPKGDYSAIIRYLQKRIPVEMARQGTAGLSIALVNGQELIWAQGFGVADKTLGKPVTPNTAFRAGALSKLLTATAALQLVEQQRLDLDAPIQDTLREFYVRSRFHSDQAAADRDITLRRLLSHQSGLPSEHLRDVRNTFAMGQMPMRISGVWLSTPPGTQVAYSNLGYALAGAAIERSSGKTSKTRCKIACSSRWR